jgi:sulfite exporter TauE/SafE
VLVAMLAVLLRDVLPPVDAISAWSERIVGAALIAVGLWALRRSTQMRTAPHAHGVVSHRHLHIESGPAWLRRLGHPHASFCLGVLHGVAGSSHFFGVLPALALPSMAASMTYIAAFGVGTVAAMTGFAGRRRHRAVPAAQWRPAAARDDGAPLSLAITVGTVWLAA